MLSASHVTGNEYRGKAAEISRSAVEEIQADALRAFVGLGKPWSVDSLSTETGIHRNTIEACRNGRQVMGLENVLRCMSVLPPEFATMLLRPAGLLVHRPGGATQESALLVTAGMSQAAADVMRAAADGKFDHVERAKLAPELRAAAAEVIGLADSLQPRD